MAKQSSIKFQLPQASVEQQSVIDALIKEQTNVICQAVAGAGKTTLILNLATQALAINPDVKILNLTFNKHLSDQNDRKIKDLGLKTNLVAKTFHAWENFPIKNDEKNGFKNIKPIKDLVKNWARQNSDQELLQAIAIKQQYNPYNEDSTFLTDYLRVLNKKIDQNQSLKTYLQDRSFQWDYVCFDEAQDVDEGLWMQILILVKTQTKAKFLILGDPYQTIYQFKGANQHFFNFADQLLKLPFRHLKLAHSFRITKSIANFINQIAKWDDWKISANPDKTKDHPVQISLLPPAIIENGDDQLVFQNLWNLLVDLIENHHYLPSDITFLSSFAIGESKNHKGAQDDPGKADIKILFDRFKQFIIKQKYQVINKNQQAILNVCEQKHKGSWHDLRFYSFHAYKGCENKVIIVVGNTFDELEYWTNAREKSYENDDKLQKPFYVGYTRALEQLYVIAFDVVKTNQQAQQIYQNKPVLARWFNETALKAAGIKIDAKGLLRWAKSINKKISIYPKADCHYQINKNVFDLKIEPAKISFLDYEDFEKLQIADLTIKNYQPLKAIDFINGVLAKSQKDPIYVRDLISPAILTLIDQVVKNPSLKLEQGLSDVVLANISQQAIKAHNIDKTNTNYQQLSAYLANQEHLEPVIKLLKQIPNFDLQTMEIERGFDLLKIISGGQKNYANNYQVGPSFKWINDPLINQQAPHLIKLLKTIKTLFNQNNQYRQVKLRFNGFCDLISKQILIEAKLNHKEQMNAFAQLILYNYFLTIENELIALIAKYEIEDAWLDDLFEQYNRQPRPPFKQLIFIGLDQGIVKKITNNQASLMELGLNLIIKTLMTNTSLDQATFLTKYQRQDLN